MLRPEQLVSRLTRRSGSPGYGLLTVAAPVWAGEIVTIGRREYVCVVGDAPPWPTDGAPRPVWVAEATNPVPAVDYLTALAAAINRDPLGVARATRKSPTELLVFGRGVLGQVSVSASFSEPGNGWSGTKFAGRRGLSTRPCVPWGAARTVVAWEAAQGVVGVTLRRRPRGFVAQVRRATGEVVAFDGRVEALGRNVVLSASGGVAFEAGMIVTVIAY